MFDIDWSWFWEFVRHLDAHPWTVQVWVAGGATFIFENVVCAGIGVLVASGDMRVDVAFVGMTIGVFVGDLLLYLPGRYAMDYLDKTKWMERNRAGLQFFEEFFSRHVGKAMFIIRFTPGVRTVALIAAGMLRVPFWSYTLFSFLSSMFQAGLVIVLAKGVIEEFLPHLKVLWKEHPSSRILIIGGALVLFFLVNKLLGSFFKKKVDKRTVPAQQRDTPFVWYETLSPFWFNLVPVLYYVWLGVKHRCVPLGLNVNPSIYASGFAGERKQDIYKLFPRKVTGDVVAPLVAVAPVSGGWAEERLRKSLELMQLEGLMFPVVAKPDIGQRGVGVQRISSEYELREYITQFPMKETFLLQELITLPEEGAALYVRLPSEEKGRIVALTHKQFVTVVGDGEHTLRQLIIADRRGLQLSTLYFHKQHARLDQVVPTGEQVMLNFAGNHGQGTIFLRVDERITEAMAAAFDAFARTAPDFYYGRIDFCFESWEKLAQGEGFRVIEVNGIGGEPVEIWDPKGNLKQAYRWLFAQCRLFFEIGAANRARGSKPLPLRQLVSDWWRIRKLVKSYPPAD